MHKTALGAICTKSECHRTQRHRGIREHAAAAAQRLSRGGTGSGPAGPVGHSQQAHAARYERVQPHVLVVAPGGERVVHRDPTVIPDRPLLLQETRPRKCNLAVAIRHPHRCGTILKHVTPGVVFEEEMDGKMGPEL